MNVLLHLEKTQLSSKVEFQGKLFTCGSQVYISLTVHVLINLDIVLVV